MPCPTLSTVLPLCHLSIARVSSQVCKACKNSATHDCDSARVAASSRPSSGNELMNHPIHVVGAFSDAAKARQVAEDLAGTLIVDPRDDTAHLPFAALVWAGTDRPAKLTAPADVGAWIACQRTIRARPDSAPSGNALPGVIGVFPIIANPKLGHDAADAHWRDNHAPLALQIHLVMTHYRQLCVIQHLHGLELDGIALCGTNTVDDLRERFFKDADGRRAILEDIAYFADTERSPRRLIATETDFG